MGKNHRPGKPRYRVFGPFIATQDMTRHVGSFADGRTRLYYKVQTSPSARSLPLSMAELHNIRVSHMSLLLWRCASRGVMNTRDERELPDAFFFCSDRDDRDHLVRYRGTQTCPCMSSMRPGRRQFGLCTHTVPTHGSFPSCEVDAIPPGR